MIFINAFMENFKLMLKKIMKKLKKNNILMFKLNYLMIIRI